jgi:hypothetical protein
MCKNASMHLVLQSTNWCCKAQIGAAKHFERTGGCKATELCKNAVKAWVLQST